MQEQVQKQHNHNANSVSQAEAEQMREDTATAQKVKVAQEAGKVIDTELEELLNDIDTVLEDEEFALTYRQQGGE